jgi:hypothetical protein
LLGKASQVSTSKKLKIGKTSSNVNNKPMRRRTGFPGSVG